MKKLNRKGFTLIELLAIIVILAVILIVAVPPLLDTMDSSKKSSLLNSAKSVASGWTNNLATAQIETPTDAGEIAIYVNWGTDWKCLNASNMATLEIDANQYVAGTGAESGLTPTAPVCSMAKIDGTSATVVLVVEAGDQMYVANFADTISGKSYMWASSDGTNSWSN